VDLAYELIIGVISGGLSEVSTLVYNALISGFCRAGRIDKALAMVSFMSRTGCKPDLVTYNVLLNYCCNEFMFEEAVKLLKKMECSAIEPDVYSYNQLLKAHCKANHPDKAYLFMVTMMNPKGFCDAVSYNTFIKEFRSICDTRRAFKLRKWGERGLPQM
jgi:pentatricopeptide repeat protein